MKRKQCFCSALIVSAMLLMLTACSTNEAMESTSSIMVEKVLVSSNASSSLPQPTSSLKSNTEVSSKETPSSSTAPIQSSSSKKSTSTATKPQQSNNSSKGGLSWGPISNDVPIHPTSGLSFKQPSDPETGLSWDGVSPIIYTYADGTTGKEKKDGATYEYIPGMYSEIIFPKDGAGRLIGSTCPICNKKVGQQYYPNSCEQFSRSQYCTQCGKFVEHNTCHSCTLKLSSTHHCSDCGKISGDGTKGTCLSYWTGGDHDCPNCGVTIPQKTCHTCSN